MKHYLPFLLILVVLVLTFGYLLLLRITDMVSLLRVSKEDGLIGFDMSRHGEKL